MITRIRQLRKELKKTIYDLAKDLNMSPSSIAMIERGERGITAENAIIFADYFRVSTDYLLGKSDVRNTKFSDIPFALGGLESELTDKDKEMIMNLAQSLADKNRGGGNL